MYIVNPGIFDQIFGSGDSGDNSSGSSGSSSSSNSDISSLLTALETIGIGDRSKVLLETAKKVLKKEYDVDSSNTSSGVDLFNYFQGFLTNQGNENMLNRQYNSAEALLNREFQSVEAQKQRDWYEAMSNSAYTRAVADMKNAGINPILAYAQGGAASSGTGIPSSSAASYNSTGGDTISSLLSAMADVIYAVSGASSNKVSTAFKLFRMAGG